MPDFTNIDRKILTDFFTSLQEAADNYEDVGMLGLPDASTDFYAQYKIYGIKDGRDLLRAFKALGVLKQLDIPSTD